MDIPCPRVSSCPGFPRSEGRRSYSRRFVHLLHYSEPAQKTPGHARRDFYRHLYSIYTSVKRSQSLPFAAFVSDSAPLISTSCT
jgi:hypothetical protein